MTNLLQERAQTGAQTGAQMNMNELPLIEVEELPGCQWVAKLERAINTPAKFEKLWGDIHRSIPTDDHIEYEPVTVGRN